MARGAPILAPLLFALACGEDTDFFDDTGAGATGGTLAAGSGGTGAGTGASGGGSGHPQAGGTAGVTAGAAGSTAGRGSGGAGGEDTGEGATGNEPASGGAGQGGGGGGGGSGGTGNTGSGGTGNAGSGGTGNTSSGGAGAGGETGQAGAAGDAGEGGSGEGGAAGAGEAGAPAGGSAGSGGTAGNGGVGGQGAAGSGGGAAGGGAGSGGDATGGFAGIGGIGGGVGGGGTGGKGGCSLNPEYCDGVDNNCGGGVDEGGSCPTSCTAATRYGRVYVFCFQTGMQNRVTWSEAMTRCKGTLSTAAGVPLDLARVESSEENAFLLEWIAARSAQVGVWMGANDTDVQDSWAWGTGSSRVIFFQDDVDGGHAVDDRFTYWGDGRPNGDIANDPDESCAHYDPVYDWRWNDRPCSNGVPGFLCEQLDSGL